MQDFITTFVILPFVMEKLAAGEGLVLVVGGSGFLGQHLVEDILERYSKTRVRIFDIRAPNFENARAEFLQGNICKVDDLVAACEGVHTIFHTASPPEGRGRELYEMVNVIGTQNVIEAAKRTSVKQIVFTSSASVVFDGHNLVKADEKTPYVTSYLDPYIETKIKAEKAILAANSETLRTCAIRPSGIFGPRDAQAWPGIIEAGNKGQQKFQLGNNSNLMDWTYVRNVTCAHCLAADKLAEKNSPVGGEAFFVTNEEPIPFWEMPKYVWNGLGYSYSKPTVIPAFLILFIALFVDWMVWILSPIVKLKPTLSYFRVVVATTTRTFDTKKARDLLGYKPEISLADGMARSLEYFKQQKNTTQ